jgi:uncharacterized protein (DUF1800 family)
MLFRMLHAVAACFALAVGVAHAQSPLSHRAANRILEQATWGPTQTPDPRLETQGFEAWFSSQLTAAVSTYADQGQYNAAGNSNTNLAPVQVQFFQNALNGPDQLRQRVAFALSEIWVISELEVNNASAFPPLMRIFQNDAFGNYEQLMKDVTLNAGMGNFLNMVNNDKANPAKGTAPNENYGREIMQLFTLGLSQLNIDGTAVLGWTGNTIPTYSQQDVDAVSAAFTGWTYAPMPGFVTTGHNRAYYIPPMVPVETNHDSGAKMILGTALPKGQSAEIDLQDALHIIFMQPSLPPFICKQLIEHLVTSNPSPAYVARVSEVFASDASGVRGNLQSVIHAILTDPEARAGDTSDTADAAFGHMREPVLFVLNLLRGLNGTVSNTSVVANAAANLGQQLFYAPSVFGYFSPSYRTAFGLIGPEFQIYSTQTASNRVNTVNSAVYNGQLDAGTKFDISGFTAVAGNNTNLINRINAVFFHNDMSSNVEDAITAALAPLTAASDKAKAALYVALTSGEYQIIH